MRPLRKETWKPQLIITDTVMNKIKQLVALSKTEISWHGFIEPLEDHAYLLYDIILFPQYNTGVTTSTDEDEYATWLDRQMKHKNFQDMRFHGHSHVNMGVTPSATDMNYRTNMVQNLKDHYFFMIINKKGDMSIAFYDAASMLIFENSDIEIIIQDKAYEKAKIWAEKAIQDNVKEAEKECSTTSSRKSSSTPTRRSKKTYTSLDAEPWEDPLQSFLFD